MHVLIDGLNCGKKFVLLFDQYYTIRPEHKRVAFIQTNDLLNIIWFVNDDEMMNN